MMMKKKISKYNIIGTNTYYIIQLYGTETVIHYDGGLLVVVARTEYKQQQQQQL